MPDARFRGLGGPRMAAAGVELLAELDDLAVMGFAEVVRRLPYFLRLERRVYRDLEEAGVDLVIPVDYPGFNLRLAGRAHRAGIPVLYYIAPQVWAWKEKRAARLAARCDLVLTVLPFENRLLEGYGVRCRFVGHPLLDDRARARRPVATRGDPAAARRLVGLFPGSRVQEIDRMLPVFTAAARRLIERRPDVDVQIARAAHLPASLYADAGFPVATMDDTLGRARAALTKSGTITLELALAGVPMAVGYRTSPLTYALARRLVRVPSISLVNLVAGAEIVPELIQDEATPEALASAIEPLLDDGEPRTLMLDALACACARLGEPGCAGRVADHAVGLLGRR